MIAIIDYDAGNIKSVEKALQYLLKQDVSEVTLTRDRDVILSADHVILPGVGSFGDAMEKLRGYGLESVIREYTESGKPFLGICLGLQLLFEESEESPGVRGLGLLKGKIRRIPEGEGRKVPQIGWNDITLNPTSRLFTGVPDHSYVYFVHSYYLEAEDRSEVAATTEYGVRIDAAVEAGNIFACQFHPEKSSEVGLQILKNFVEL
ncbi:MAG: imidazole glycerol phosphate synthase subunit HisH [Eubacterium sp.]|nr:imidazole glycerol phosphate synthase subunit HisH [Eubacterium sp.]